MSRILPRPCFCWRRAWPSTPFTKKTEAAADWISGSNRTRQGSLNVSSVRAGFGFSRGGTGGNIGAPHGEAEGRRQQTEAAHAAHHAADRGAGAEVEGIAAGA